MMNSPSGCKFLILVLSFFCFFEWFEPTTAVAKSAVYGSRPSGFALATGCGIGMGPQYQSYDPRIGRLVTVGNFQYVDFNPLALCRKAANLCESQPSGQFCCLNACRQTFSGYNAKIPDGAKDLFQSCVRKCPRLHTFRKKNKIREKRSTIFHTSK